MYKQFLTDFGFAGAIVAVLVLILWQPAVNASIAGGPGCSEGSPLLDRTIYIEADEDSQAEGYVGFTLSPHAPTGGYRVEVIGADRHEGTILVHSDENCSVYFSATTRDLQTVDVTFEMNSERGGHVLLNGTHVANWIQLSSGEQFLNVLSSIAPATDTTAHEMLIAVLKDSNVLTTFETYDPFIAGMFWLAVAMLIVAIVTVVIATLAWVFPMPTGPPPVIYSWEDCIDWHSTCYDNDYDENHPSCQAYVDPPCNGTLGAPPSLVAHCQELDEACSDPYNPDFQDACQEYVDLNCANILNP